MLSEVTNRRKPKMLSAPQSKARKLRRVQVNDCITSPASAESSRTMPLASPRNAGRSVPTLDDSQDWPNERTITLVSMPQMTVPVGPFNYTLYLFPGLIPYLGKMAQGVCDSTMHRIFVSDAIPPQARLSTFWHEIAHAWVFETREDPYRPLSNEEFARFAGIAMAGIGSDFLSAIERFLKIDRRAGQ